MKKLLIALLAGCIIGISCVVLSDVFMNPGKDFFFAAFDKSESWAAALRCESDAPCYVLEGSSDVRMSLDPELMKEECGVRAINAGAHAANGANVNFVEALRLASPGDTIVSIPVAVWKPADDNPAGGVKFLFYRHGFRAFEPGVVDCTPKHLLHLLRGNTFTFFMHLGKLAQNIPTAYKYTRIGTLHESGWVEVRATLRTKQTRTLPRKPLELRDAVAAIPFKSRKCAQLGLSLIVQMPRSYDGESYRAMHAYEALYLVRQGIPVLKDPALGVETDPNMLADTSLHHNAEGSRAYSRTLAHLIADKEFWTEAELIEKLHDLGWNDDGTPVSAH